MVMHADERQQPDLLRLGAVAVLLCVHPNTLRRWTQQGILKSYRVGPRQDRRFERKGVLALLNTGGEQ